MKFMIIGNGIAALQAAENIRKNDSESKITMISREKYNTYYRVKLSHLLGQQFDLEKLYVKPNQWYEDNNIDVLLKRNVTSVDTDKKIVKLDDGSILEYDILIIASGSYSFIPPVKGNDKKGVYAVRSLDDVEKLNEYINGKKRGVVVGGGLLGLEAAWSLRQIGYDVTVIEFFPRLLPKQSDEEGSRIIEKIIEDSGIKLVLGAEVDEITGDPADGVVLKNKDKVDADFVIFSAGVRPNLDAINGSGIKINKGILVDDFMKTSIDDVYAAGDVAEHNGKIYGLWTVALAQGRTAGLNAVGVKTAYKEVLPSSTLKITGVDVFSSGDIFDEAAATYRYKNGNVYYKLFVKENKLIGAILIGDITYSAKAKKAIDSRVDLKELLISAKDAKEVLEKI
ncbi:FAD-dependent pyridine nucleotide-disulfide oxidoreductase [Thermoanaerobacterium aotearoense SCUT27]|uniref:FAD-dependent pyridine nucleotide-disulfide oxidoreductase n=2 Tax=Thermoanaerobacterium TaxID=28895 RepID=W9EEU1_9THEO|nr:FAD-dependent pyridine nucleotide-disulfide oxidoreductase [Thermoanaerobacterium saccharolyticum JW/SL-YS485]ETO38264.1 FAD-dependent pyridine nucleotide-disulfide oxidoreductase [Thermoanaerobacterium aotearoense SCUT27]